MINLLAYNGTGELLPATEVELKLGDKIIKVIAVDTNLNCGAAYSFPTPAKWRKQIGNDVTSHSGKVSILLEVTIITTILLSLRRISGECLYSKVNYQVDI